MSLYLRSRTAFIAGVLLALPLATLADQFGNPENDSWADTPRGRFECRYEGTLSTFKFAGSVVYKERRTGGGDYTGFLNGGIDNASFGCPRVLASERGFVVIRRPIQPPHYGIDGYAVINFNQPDYPITELAESQRSGDDKIPDSKRFKWEADGFALSYFGYGEDQHGASGKSPKPRKHQVFYYFDDNGISYLK